MHVRVCRFVWRIYVSGRQQCAACTRINTSAERACVRATNAYMFICNITCIHTKHCTTLHHTAPHCTTLQHTATRCNTLHHTATHCTTLQHLAPHCNTLHQTATHCTTLQHPYNITCIHTKQELSESTKKRC